MHNSLEPERECTAEEYVYCGEGGSQASPAGPSDKGSCGSEDVGWLEAVALRQGPRDLNFLN